MAILYYGNTLLLLLLWLLVLAMALLAELKWLYLSGAILAAH